MAKLSKPATKRDVDYMGAGLLTAGLTALLLSITRIGQGAHILDTDILWMLAITVVSLGLYGRNALRSSEPIIPLELFRIRTVTISCLILFVAFIQLISLTVLIPLELQMLTSLDADGAALRLIPLSVSVPLGAYIGGKLMARSGKFKYIQLTGTIALPISVFWLSMISPTAAGSMSVCLALIGIGIGLQLPTSMVAVQNAVPHQHVGVATGVSAFCRSLGSAMGIALLMAFLLMNLRLGAHAADAVLTGSDMINMLLGNDAMELGTLSRSTLTMTAESAFQNVYRLAAFIAVSSIILTLCLKDEHLSDRTPPTARTRRPHP